MHIHTKQISLSVPNHIYEQWHRLERTTEEELLGPTATLAGLNISRRPAAGCVCAEGSVEQDQEARHFARYNEPLATAKRRASVHIRARGPYGHGLQPLVSFRSS
ncbi:hypothetical protein RHGRI_018269 [Rhododendron griersonianum]|uniref:Uncharacterized protein n=1 Tax=Rhododendron griersonianum TaxID=479676 RepID=A0AAV6K0U4_9ERIC|nr:hypothetical protein RHGRI_018269 [Rhododendron griersonianum]